MFFYLSKIIWFFIQPLGLIFLFVALALIASLFKMRGYAILHALMALSLLVLCCGTNLGQVLIQPLEQRFERPDPLPKKIAGIIVLGGGMAGAINGVRGGYELESAGDRFVEGAILARRYGNAKLLISGGSGALLTKGTGDAESSMQLFLKLGIERDRLLLENDSRNTQENAQMSAKLIGNLDDNHGDAPWLLVTSAFHMPRSFDLYRKAGINVVPWPSDYRSDGQTVLGRASSPPDIALRDTTQALREWIGLFAYRITGKIDSIFPAPAKKGKVSSDDS